MSQVFVANNNICKSSGGYRMTCQFHREDGLPEAERPLIKLALQLLFQRGKDGILHVSNPNSLTVLYVLIQ